MRIFKKLYVQVLVAIALAIVVGLAAPQQAVAMKPLGDGFIAMLKMILGPIIFFTVVHGVGHIKDFRRLGRLGVKTLLYFEVVSTLAMAVGWTMVHWIRPGAGLHATNLAVNGGALADISKATHADFTFTHFALSIIPKTLGEAFVSGDILPVLLVSLLVGFALSSIAKPDWAVFKLIDEGQAIIFKILAFIMRLSPIGAFGAMASAVGHYGADTLLYLLRYVLTYYASAIVFVIVVLGLVAACAGLSIFSILSLIKEEALLAMGTAASEVAFPRMVTKLKQAGCDELVVGFVLPAGYSFNIDGACIYMACGLGFIAQATDTTLSASQWLSLLFVMLLTSKGGAGAAGGAFVKLAGTVQSTAVLPLNGVALLFGIDRMLAAATSTVNVVGNCVATLVIAKSEGMLNEDAYRAALGRGDRTPSLPATVRERGPTDRAIRPERGNEAVGGAMRNGLSIPLNTGDKS